MALLIHQIIFFDSNKETIDAYQKVLKDFPGISFKNAYFEDMIKNTKFDMVVSPANSYLSMSGGIDATYAKLFPGIEDRLRNKVIEKKYAKSKTKYRGTKYVLPIGRAIVCQTKNMRCPFILASPTMVTPKDITDTENVYQAMRAIIKKISKVNIPMIVACPCLGTGIGNLDPKESAEQVKMVLLEDV